MLIGGRTFRLGRGFLHDIGGQPQAYRIAHLGAALLVLHSPQDTVVGVDNARGIYQAARHPKSFISLDGADHLLADPADAGYVADVITAWAARYLPPRTAVIDPVATDPIPARAVDVAWSGIGRYRQAVRTGTHDWVVDEPVSVGGDDAGPNPYDQLLAALARPSPCGCTRTGKAGHCNMSRCGCGTTASSRRTAPTAPSAAGR